jgi:hypothetical protein
MHDPMTVAFEIRYPWPFPRERYTIVNLKGEKEERRGNRPQLLTIWHRDPERDGSDDSCGWCFPRIGRELREKIHAEADSEYKMNALFDPEGRPTMDPVSLLFAVFQIVAWRFFGRSITSRDLPMILSLTSNPIGNMQSELSACISQEEMRSLFRIVASNYLRSRRPWWKHPKWHVWHWRLQVHPLQKLKRFLFSRCAVCGKRFRWGYAPVSHVWHGEGPRWFRREKGVMHHECARKDGKQG